MTKNYLLFLTLCFSLVNAMDTDTQPDQVEQLNLPAEYHLINHNNTDFFGKKAVIYVGDIKRLSLPKDMTSDSHTVSESDLTIHPHQNYYDAIINYALKKHNTKTHKSSFIEITKEQRDNIEDPKHKFPTFPNDYYQVFTANETSYMSEFPSPQWYYMATKWNDPNAYMINFITTDDLPTPQYSNKKKICFAAAVSLMALLITYLYRTSQTPDFINNLITAIQK